MLARDRDVTAAEADAIARLAAVDGAVAEVQLDPPHGALVAVLGFAAPAARSLLAAPGLARWLDAIAPDASHWGVKLGAPRQVYARGRFDAAQAVALGAQTRAADLERLLAVTGAGVFSMLGVEHDGGAIVRHVGYVAITGAQAVEALAAARGVPADVALLAPGPGWLHLSWDLATSTGPFKIDAGARPAGDAIALATRLGLDGAALASRLAALGLGDPSHVGLRIGAAPARALALYFRVTAS
jgi:hypothetical protein